jgi:hypothetical protein
MLNDNIESQVLHSSSNLDAHTKVPHTHTENKILEGLILKWKNAPIIRRNYYNKLLSLWRLSP